MNIKGFFSLRRLLLTLLILSSSNNHTALAMLKVYSQSSSNQGYHQSLTPIYSEANGELLDLFGVVLRVDKDLANKECQKIDPKFDAETIMSSPLWPKLDLNKARAEDVAAYICDKIDYFATLYFIQTIRRYIKPNRIGMEIFKAIKQENPEHKIHILSNLSKYCITGDHNICTSEYFETAGQEDNAEYPNIFNDGAVFSCDVKLAKPGLDIFKQALKQFNLENQIVYFTDDSLSNLKGALQAGLYPISAQCHSVWYLTCLRLGRISQNETIEKLLNTYEPKEFELFKNFELSELQNFEQIALDLKEIRRLK